MKITLSIIKADIGSIGGHIKPSQKLKEAVNEHVKSKGLGKGLLKDFYISSTGDDVAILMSHQKGKLDSDIHKLAWDAFIKGTEVAKSQGLYGAGQDLLKDAFSGNVKGMGPAVAEIELDERPNESFIFFAADKTDPGAYNLPLYLAFTDPMRNAGLMLSPKMEGFRFIIMDVSHTEADRSYIKNSYSVNNVHILKTFHLKSEKGGNVMQLLENLFRGEIIRYRRENFSTGNLKSKEIRVGIPNAVVFLVLLIIQLLMGNWWLR